jgi:hypothetical protein
LSIFIGGAVPGGNAHKRLFPEEKAAFEAVCTGTSTPVLL